MRKRFASRRLARDDLAGIVIEHDVLARRHDGERHRGGNAAQNAEHHEQAFASRRHVIALGRHRQRAPGPQRAPRRGSGAPTRDSSASTTQAKPKHGHT